MTNSITHSLEQVQYVVNSLVLFSLVSDSDGCGCFAILYYYVCHAHSLFKSFSGNNSSPVCCPFEMPMFPKKKKSSIFLFKIGNRGWQPTDWKHTLTCLHGDTKVWRWLNVTNKKTLQRCKSLLFQGSRWVAEKYLHLFVSVFISSGIRNLLEDWDTVRKHNERV